MAVILPVITASIKPGTIQWQYGERRYLSQTSLQHLTDMLHTGGRPALPAITT